MHTASGATGAQVFILDKKRAAEQGGSEPFNRIRRALGAELAALAPADRVLLVPVVGRGGGFLSFVWGFQRVFRVTIQRLSVHAASSGWGSWLGADRASLPHLRACAVREGCCSAQLGTSAAPQTCKRKDEEALLAVFRKQLHVPLPGYASQQAWIGRMCLVLFVMLLMMHTPHRHQPWRLDRCHSFKALLVRACPAPCQDAWAGSCVERHAMLMMSVRHPLQGCGSSVWPVHGIRVCQRSNQADEGQGQSAGCSHCGQCADSCNTVHSSWWVSAGGVAGPV